MKTKTKRLRNPESQPRGRPGKRILHLLRLAVFTLLLTALLALLCLIIIGVPEPLTREITSELQEKEIPIQIDSISLSTRHGWVVHNLRIYSPDPDDLPPLLQADKLYLFIWPDDWTRLSNTEWSVSLSGKQVKVSLGRPWERALSETHPFKTIEQLHARLRVDPSGVTLESAEIDWGGIHLNAAGRFEFPAEKLPLRPALYSSLQTVAPQVAKALAKLMFDTPPELSLHFDVPADAPENVQADVSLLAAGLHRRGRTYEQISGKAHLRGKELLLDALRIEQQQENRRLQLTGRYDPAAGTAQAELTNTLLFGELLSLLPQEAGAGIGASAFRPSGTADFTATFGPCPPRNLLEQVRVQIQNLPGSFRGIAFDPLRMDLERTGSRIEIKNIQTQAGGHPLSGDADVYLDSGAWRFSAQGRVPTAPIGGLLGGGAQEWIDRTEFTNRFATTAVNASWGGTDGTFKMSSAVSGRDAVCAGIPLDTLDLAMAYSNRTFTLNPIRASRGEREFTGTINIEFDRNLAFFEADSSFAPETIAQIIAPDHPTVLTNFTFAGPLTSSASGRIDYSGGTNHSVQGSIRTDSVSAGTWTADSFKSDIKAQGSALIFTNSSMNILGGSVSGSAVFDLQSNDSTTPYRLDLDADDLDVKALLQQLSADPSETAAGRLSATLDVAADANAGFWASANGSGTAEIKNGQLRDLPVLGGFSRLIRTTLPGFSLFSLTTLHSEYELRDGTFYSDNTQIGGTLFSARARGKYSQQNGLDFTVRAEPLRQTRENKEWYQIQLWAADVLKKGTAPLFELLEFRLTGPLDQPQWRLENLPGELSTLLQAPAGLTDDLFRGHPSE